MFDELISWINANQGVVSILIISVTLFLGWVSGVFKSLRRKPKFKIVLIDGPTLCSTFPIGEKHEGYDVHRTSISLYLSISNIGSAPASVKNVSVAYHWNLRPFSIAWLRYRVFWYWIDDPTLTMNDFQYQLGENVRVFPFLFQGSAILGKATRTYLEIGQSVNGIVYFEQEKSFGGCFPLPKAGKTRVRVAVTDIFGTQYKKNFWVPIVTLEEAKKYNPSFGETYRALDDNNISEPSVPTAD